MMRNLLSHGTNSHEPPKRKLVFFVSLKSFASARPSVSPFKAHKPPPLSHQKRSGRTQSCNDPQRSPTVLEGAAIVGLHVRFVATRTCACQRKEIRNRNKYGCNHNENWRHKSWTLTRRLRPRGRMPCVGTDCVAPFDNLLHQKCCATTLWLSV